MEILIAIGILYGFWPVIVGTLMIIDTIIRSVYFWIVVGLIALWSVISYFYKGNNRKDKK